MKNKKKIFISFLGNIFFDTRTFNLFNSLTSENYDTNVVCFDWKDSGSTSTDKIKIFEINRRPSLFFYFKFAYLLKLSAFKTKADIYIAEDIYSLPFIVIIAKWYKAKIVYDSREVYSHLAGLKEKPLLQKLIKYIEKTFIKHVDLTLAVGEMDIKFIRDLYNIDNTLVVRNLPLLKEPSEKMNYKKLLNLDNNAKVLLYQGMILHGRGLKIAFEVIKEIDNTFLVILGSGDEEEYYKKLAIDYNINTKVFFMGQKNQSELINYTSGADIGLSIIENLSLSYYYALPNKLFEYIMAEVPVIASNFPQMKQIVEGYNIGFCVNVDSINEISSLLRNILRDDSLLDMLKNNCHKAKTELCWENEFCKLKNELEKWN